jgi:hypothetical protein
LGLFLDDRDSTFLACGWYQDSLMIVQNTQPVGFVEKIDLHGNRLLFKRYNDYFDVFTIKPALDGGYWMTGEQRQAVNCPSWNFNMDLVLLKTDVFGVEEDHYVTGGECGWEFGDIVEYELDKVK